MLYQALIRGFTFRIGNECDNCPFDKNPDQKDANNDGTGDACVRDRDGDGMAKFLLFVFF